MSAPLFGVVVLPLQCLGQKHYRIRFPGRIQSRVLRAPKCAYVDNYSGKTCCCGVVVFLKLSQITLGPGRYLLRTRRFQVVEYSEHHNRKQPERAHDLQLSPLLRCRPREVPKSGRIVGEQLELKTVRTRCHTKNISFNLEIRLKDI